MLGGCALKKLEKQPLSYRKRLFYGCESRTRTCDLRVMSCGLDGVSAPLRAFVTFLLGRKIGFDPLCSVGSARSEPRMGHGLGQVSTGLSASKMAVIDTSEAGMTKVVVALFGSENSTPVVLLSQRTKW